MPLLKTPKKKKDSSRVTKPEDEPRRGPGQPPFNPTEVQREQVKAMCSYGIPEHEIAGVIGIDPKTLRKHFRAELDTAMAEANSKVAGFLYNAAQSGNVTAQIFWLKTRARWKEPPQDHQHSGAIGSYDLTRVSDADLKRLESILGAAVLGSNPGGD